MKPYLSFFSKRNITVGNYSIFKTFLVTFLFMGSPLCPPVKAEEKTQETRAILDLTTFDRADEASGTLFFSSPAGSLPAPKPLKTELSEVKYIGVIRPREGAPYFLLNAKPCKTCQDEPALFALRPNDKKPTAFVYPGKILDPKSRAVLLESRAFFGKCLPGHEESYIVFQQERVDRRPRLQPSVLIEEAAKDHLIETLIDRHAPKLKTVLQQVKRKLCKEIEGRNRLMLSRPLDLHPNSGIGDDEEDDSDEPGEGGPDAQTREKGADNANP